MYLKAFTIMFLKFNFTPQNGETFFNKTFEEWSPKISIGCQNEWKSNYRQKLSKENEKTVRNVKKVFAQNIGGQM